ncbi:hypothetical protein F5544_32490 [Nocardia arthritidis]|uniref:WXG100 family type VII secretion target n=1 Tax=Nocardia arthritidis TaxID=228602 RepID=A0A6G9YM13_9NOCA|nr:hypothetical protein F5544_32490 [Nocardia arthritidis]
MSSKFKVDLDQLDDIVARLKGLSEFVHEHVDQLEGEVNKLPGIWRGIGAGAYAGAHREWATGAREFAEGVADMSKAARDQHGRYGTAIETNRRMLIQTGAAAADGIRNPLRLRHGGTAYGKRQSRQRYRFQYQRTRHAGCRGLRKVAERGYGPIIEWQQRVEDVRRSSDDHRRQRPHRRHHRHLRARRRSQSSADRRPFAHIAHR